MLSIEDTEDLLGNIQLSELYKTGQISPIQWIQWLAKLIALQLLSQGKCCLKDQGNTDIGQSSKIEAWVYISCNRHRVYCINVTN